MKEEITPSDFEEWMRDRVTKEFMSRIKELREGLAGAWMTPLEGGINQIAVYHAYRMGKIAGIDSCLNPQPPGDEDSLDIGEVPYG